MQVRSYYIIIMLAGKLITRGNYARAHANEDTSVKARRDTRVRMCTLIFAEDSRNRWQHCVTS